MSLGVVLLYTVCGSEEEAERIARSVVEAKLAVCANYWPISSVYEWNGEVTADREVAMLLKTVPERFEELMARVRELHSYELPCLLVLSPIDADADYAAWVRLGSVGISSTRPA